MAKINDVHLWKSWEKAAFYRRMLLGSLIAATTLVASGYMAYVLPNQGRGVLEMVLVFFFAMLFAWISVGFWTAVMGFFIMWRGFDRFDITRTLAGADEPTPIDSRTAIIMPIYNESVDRVFAGLKATYRSLEQTGQLGVFDFFVLSDSTNPDMWALEEFAWAEFCQTHGAFNKLYYRHRRPNIKRKSGNIADFCRRWGRNYRYMIVLDADSVMAGETLVQMVNIMERNPGAGILQTLPMAVGRESLIARIQQFAGRVYGPVFSAGLHFWQIGDAQYWGHNAIIQVEPFMRHCGLPRLSGRPPMGGDILSHDFVEAALMRRAGWGVWLAYGLKGSWEEPPSTLLDELARDRRWCQGNIQHMRLLFTRGLFPAHRVLFLNGAMSYVSALLWLLFLAASTLEAVFQAIYEPNYFPHERSLFPDWPVWNPGWALTLLTSTLVILFVPKLLSLFLIVVKERRAQSFGGILKICLSVAAEVNFSALFAPVRMLSHSKFVFATLLGRQVAWNPPPREARGTGWREALRFHGGGMVLAAVWGSGVFYLNRSFFWWLVPILIPLLFSVPLSVWSSKTSAGQAFRRRGLFLTPEEISPPPELRMLAHHLAASARTAYPLFMRPEEGFVRAVADPSANRLHLALRRGKRSVSATIAKRRKNLVEKALNIGPNALTESEKFEILMDAGSLSSLHRKVWELPQGDLARQWGLASF